MKKIFSNNKIKHWLGDNSIFLIIPVFISVLLIPLDEKGGNDSDAGPIKRIVSLSPAITRQLIDLDAEDLLIGVTSYHPPLSRKIEIVGTLIQPNIEKIVILKPHIVLISGEDVGVQFLEMLNATNIRTHTFGMNYNYDVICDNYLQLARLINKSGLAKNKIKKYRKSLRSAISESDKMSIALFVSSKPIMGVSNVSYIGKIIGDAGGVNCLRLLKRPYPTLSLEHLIILDPDIIISVLYHDGKTGDSFKKMLNNFSDLTTVKRQSFYTIPEEFICYYTPGDYVKAVNQVCEIITKETEKLNEKK